MNKSRYSQIMAIETLQAKLICTDADTNEQYQSSAVLILSGLTLLPLRG